MPYNGSGSASASGSGNYPASASTLIESAKHNALIADFLTMFSTAICKDGQTTTTQRIPFAAGISTDTVNEQSAGTGVTLDSVLLKDGRVDTTQGGDIACAATLNLETATGNVVDVTGATGPVTAITLSQGHWRFVRFTGAPTLTNGASLVLPGGADITAAAGDYALFIGYAAGVVRCAMYVPASAAGLLFRLTDPAADRILFWDDSAGANAHLALSGLTITGTTLAVDAATDTAAGKVELATTAEVQTGTDTTRAVTPAGMQNGKIVVNAAVATTAGVAVALNEAIPAWAKRVTLAFNGVSSTGTSPWMIQIGDGGGYESAGYAGRAAEVSVGTTGGGTNGFHLQVAAVAANVAHGKVVLELIDAAAFTWSMDGNIVYVGGEVFVSNGTKALSAALDRVQITTNGGADTFDAGSIVVTYE